VRLPFHTLDVFTERRFGGNPLAVVVGADELLPSTMQTLAREFNLSETVFVLAPTEPSAHRRLRIFTPGRELPFAGHPTVGAAVALALRGELPPPDVDGAFRFVFEEEVGPVPMEVRIGDGHRFHATLETAKVPERIDAAVPETGAIAALLSLDEKDIQRGSFPPAIWSAGVPFLLVAVEDPAAVSRVQFRNDVWRIGFEGTPGQEVFVFARDLKRDGSPFRARMFAPGVGVAEDPATGSAVAALAGLLATRAHDGVLDEVVEQGVDMGRPSRIDLRVVVANHLATNVRVGGEALPVVTGHLEI
jgi:trans-2,3-dihydro-3-hydroxyanthranilate isomerase